MGCFHEYILRNDGTWNNNNIGVALINHTLYLGSNAIKIPFFLRICTAILYKAFGAMFVAGSAGDE